MVPDRLYTLPTPGVRLKPYDQGRHHKERPLASGIGGGHLGVMRDPHGCFDRVLCLPVQPGLWPPFYEGEQARRAEKQQALINPTLAPCQHGRRPLSASKTGLKMARRYLSYLLCTKSLQRVAGFHAEFSPLIPLCQL